MRRILRSCRRWWPSPTGTGRNGSAIDWIAYRQRRAESSACRPPHVSTIRGCCSGRRVTRSCADERAGGAQRLAFDETVGAHHLRPQHGGKTVTLKLLGLFSLMVRCGLHLPCAPESEMAIFPRCTPISEMRRIWHEICPAFLRIYADGAAARRCPTEPASGGPSTSGVPRSCAGLVDEPVTSTDPAEGAALASAFTLSVGRGWGEGCGHHALQRPEGLPTSGQDLPMRVSNSISRPCHRPQSDQGQTGGLLR